MAIPPISHYKDEVQEDNTTQDILNQELEKEVSNARVAEQSTQELKVLPVKQQSKKSVSNIVNAFRQKMASNYNSIELPSVGKTIDFKEISVTEQKELSKVALENESRSDIMYCSMLGMINRLAVEKGFDIRNYTEFERIAITLNLQQLSKMNPEIKYTCSKCGKENSYRLDTIKMLKQFNKSYHSDIEFSSDTVGRRYSFILGWPNVRSVEEFFKSYYKKYDNSSKTTKDRINQLSQIEYITMFIKSVKMAELNDPEDSITANLDEMPYSDRVQIIDALPQNIIFDDENGAVTKVIDTFVNPMNDCFKYQDCSYCGAEQTGAMANVTDFIGY